MDTVTVFQVHEFLSGTVTVEPGLDSTFAIFFFWDSLQGSALSHSHMVLEFELFGI